MKIKQPTRGFGVFEQFLAKKRANLANKFIPDNARNGNILDIGCGSEPFFLLNTKFKNKYGIDPFTNGKFNDITIKKISAGKDKLPFENNFFDTVVMLAVFEHIDQKQIASIIREIRRILKQDGIFIVTTPAPWADWLLHLMAKFSLISKEEIHEHKTHHSKSEITKILINSGFSKENVKSGFFELFMNMWFTASK